MIHKSPFGLELCPCCGCMAKTKVVKKGSKRYVRCLKCGALK